MRGSSRCLLVAGGANTLFTDLAVVLLAAGATALIFHRLRQPAVLGYLLAGFFVGPYSWGPSFVSDGPVMTFLGELGIVFLLFALGLEFNLRKLRRVGMTAILAGVIEISLMLWLGYTLGRAFGWSPFESIFLGSIMSISSTTIIVKVLDGMGKKTEGWAQIAFGILIIEDILAVLILTGLSSASASGNFDPELLGTLVWKMVLFLSTALVLGLMVAPRLVDFLARLEAAELSIVVSVGAAFGFALLAAKLGFSAGLGAFIAGALMAESPRSPMIEHAIAPLRDVFTAIFFVTIGALVDPAALVANWPLILAVTACVVAGKTLGLSVATFAAGVPPANALRVGMTMSQIGEFSFVIAALGVSLAVTRPDLVPIAVAVSTLTAFLTPVLIRSAPRVAEGLGRRVPAGLQAYAAGYHSWAGRLSQSDRSSQEWRTVRKMAGRTALYSVVILAIFALAAATVDDALTLAGLPHGDTFLALAWVGVVVIEAPFALAWYHAVHTLIRSLARAAVPQRLRKAHVTNVERMLRGTFGLIAAVLTGIVVLVVTAPILPALYALGAVGVGVAVSSVLLGQKIKRFHAQVEATLERVMAGNDAVERPDQALQIVNGSEAWGAAVRQVDLPAVSGGTGRSIGQLRLRTLTGASVVSVRSRDGSIVINPLAEHRFVEGDEVMLLGDEESLVRAEEILLGRDLGVEGGATEIAVLHDSPLVGAPLRMAAALELAGADVLVVRRGGVSLAAVADLVLAADDVLVVSGTPDEVQALAESLRCRRVLPASVTPVAPTGSTNAR